MRETKLNTLRPAELIQAIQIHYVASKPIMVWGSPGTAKSSCARQAADIIAQQLVDEGKIKSVDEFQFNDLRGSQLDSVDTRGF